MEFTREPVIETVITPKEGCKLVVRSSKNSGQEEYFVDAIEVVSFGHTFFFRSLEKPKAFLVPTSDYEILEVRETRMVLKNVGLDRSIKIGGGRDASIRAGKEGEKTESLVSEKEPLPVDQKTERSDRKRDRRRSTRRRRGAGAAETPSDAPETLSSDHPTLVQPLSSEVFAHGEPPTAANLTTMLGSLLPPPPTLISETIKRYKDNELFRGAFFREEEMAPLESVTSAQPMEALQPPLPPLALEAKEATTMAVEEEESPGEG